MDDAARQVIQAREQGSIAPLIATVLKYNGQIDAEEWFNEMNDILSMTVAGNNAFTDARKILALKSKLASRYRLPANNTYNFGAGDIVVTTPEEFLVYLRAKYIQENVEDSTKVILRLTKEKFKPDDDAETFESWIKPILHGQKGPGIMEALLNCLSDVEYLQNKLDIRLNGRPAVERTPENFLIDLRTCWRQWGKKGSGSQAGVQRSKYPELDQFRQELEELKNKRHDFEAERYNQEQIDQVRQQMQELKSKISLSPNYDRSKHRPPPHRPAYGRPGYENPPIPPKGPIDSEFVEDYHSWAEDKYYPDPKEKKVSLEDSIKELFEANFNKLSQRLVAFEKKQKAPLHRSNLKKIIIQ